MYQVKNLTHNQVKKGFETYEDALRFCFDFCTEHMPYDIHGCQRQLDIEEYEE